MIVVFLLLGFVSFWAWLVLELAVGAASLLLDPGAADIVRTRLG